MGLEPPPRTVGRGLVEEVSRAFRRGALGGDGDVGDGSQHQFEALEDGGVWVGGP